MSHFLSHVTLSRLEARKADADRTHTDTLKCQSTDVIGNLRCVVLSVTPSSSQRDGDDVPCMWCGEHDGSITVRDIDNGNVICALERKVPPSVAHQTMPPSPAGSSAASAHHYQQLGNTSSSVGGKIFVFALCSPRRDHVWAGLSDGTIRVFHSIRCQPIFDFRAHSSAVASLCPVSMPTNDEEFEHHMNIVVSCSKDWTICKWDSTTFQCLGKLTGQRTGVRCLAPNMSGEFIASGGDDGIIRMWSLLLNEEIQPTAVADNCGDVEQEAAWPVQAHSSPVSCLLMVGDNFIVSTGFDGYAKVWSMSGAFVTNLDARPCGLTQVFQDATGERLWVAGIDGDIKIFSNEYPTFAPLTVLRDHSGAYVSAVVGSRRDLLQRWWALGADGAVTFFAESLRSGVNDGEVSTGAITHNDVAAMEAIDDLRHSVVESYGELRKHRTSLMNAEQYQRKQREKAVLLLGDNSRAKQFALYRVERWLWRRNRIELAKLRCLWMERASTKRFTSIALWRWVLFTRMQTSVRLRQKMTEAVRSATNRTMQDRACRQLLYRRNATELYNCKLLPLIQALTIKGLNTIRHRFFAKWLATLIKIRRHGHHMSTRQYTTRILQLTNAACDHRRWVSDENRELLHIRNEYIASQLLCRCNERLLAASLERWLCLTQDKRKLRNEFPPPSDENSEEKISYSSTVRHQLLLGRYYHKWAHFTLQRQLLSELEKPEELAAEVAMWEELIRNAETSKEDLANEKREREAAVSELDIELAALREQCKTTMEDIQALKTDLTTSVPLGFDAKGESLEERVDAIFTFMKARGINCNRDFPSISQAKEEYSVLPLLPPRSSVSHTATPQRTTTPARRASVPVSSAKKVPSGGSSSPRTKATVPRNLITELYVVLKSLRAQVEAAASALPAREAISSVRLGLLEDLKGDEGFIQMLRESQDWGVEASSVDSFKRKELKEIAATLRRLIVLYDCVVHKLQDVPQPPPASSSQPPPSIPEQFLREILCNGAIILRIATFDFHESTLEYVTEASVLTKKERVVVPSQQDSADAKHGSGEEGSPATAPSNGSQTQSKKTSAPNPATTISRRHSSPAASLRRASTPSAATPRPKAAVASSEQRAEQQGSIEHSPQPAAQSPSGKSASNAAPKPYLGLRVSPAVRGEGKGSACIVVSECTEVTADGTPGPSFAAGLRVGDVIVRFAGYAVVDLPQFNVIVSRHVRCGASVPVVVQSEGSSATRNLTIGVGSR